MGLAASQARFLGLTSRKNQCENQSTMLAQQKLELTNQMSLISQDYMTSLNATKLLWSNDSINDQEIPLSYDLLMTPSVKNDFDPYFLTTPSGAIILNSKYASIASNLGIPKSGGNGSANQRNKFIEALSGNKFITEPTSDKILNPEIKYDDDGNIINNPNENPKVKFDKEGNPIIKVNWNPDAGVGGTPLNKSLMSTATLADILLSENISSKPIFPNTLETDLFSSDKDKLQKNKINIYDNGIKITNADTIKDLTLLDILSGNIVFESGRETWKKLSNNNGIFSLDPSDIIDSIFNSEGSKETEEQPTKGTQEVINLMFDNIVKLLGYEPGKSGITNIGLSVDEASANALKYAYEMTKSKCLNYSTMKSGGKDVSDSNLMNNSAFNAANEYNSLVKDSKNGGTYYAVNLTNVMKSFLTYFAASLENLHSDYFVGDSVATSVYVTSDPEYKFIFNGDNNFVGENDERIADFYDELYNNILRYGWREDSLVDDPDYLSNSIKNGRISMASLNQDGYYYQTRYNDTGYLIEVADNDAIARAEAEFTAKKYEITYKENNIDMKTKKLDMEISSITTELDSVKSLISKSIDKAFSTYQG